MDAALEPPKSAWERFQQKLADSRVFAISLALHILLVIFAGGIVLIKAVTEDSDFVAEGGDGLLAPTDSLPPAPETPSDSVPAESFDQAQPDVASPNVDVISTTASTNSFKVAAAPVRVALGATPQDLSKATNNVSKSMGGSGGIPGAMSGRLGAKRGALAKEKGQKTASEQAVMKALEWLRVNQKADGSWGDESSSAMTGLALLCFLGHGETNESQQYGLTVSKGIQWIIDNGTKFQGHLNMAKDFNYQQAVYEHAIATYALGEYFSMTKDERASELLKQAVGYVVDGQNAAGGWMYKYDKAAGNDLSVGGWQIQALKAAHLTGLNIPEVDKTLDKAIECIEKMKGAKGGYGYRGPEDRYTLSGVGVLCRLFWDADKSRVARGMDFIMDTTKANPLKYKVNGNLYAWYYHTQAALMFGGDVWSRWNGWFQDEVVGNQNSDGSWPQPGGQLHGPKSEASLSVYRTCLCTLMLEVYYRYMPSMR